MLAAVGRTVRTNWLLYLFEGLELAIFMLSACAFTVFLFDSRWPMLRWIPNQTVRRGMMGIAMGITAVFIIHSSMGKRSGAHFNPAITLTYLRLGKMRWIDSLCYVLSQFAGGVFGVGVAILLFGHTLADPTVEYAITVPGSFGTAGAFAAEFLMGAVLMGVVLWTSNRPAFAAYTSYCVGILISIYVLLFAPVSGFSVNPARTTGSAVFAGIWTSIWIYFTAPILGMLSSAEIYVHSYGHDRILCAKLHPDHHYDCPFLCHYPGHKHRSDGASK